MINENTRKGSKHRSIKMCTGKLIVPLIKDKSWYLLNHDNVLVECSVLPNN